MNNESALDYLIDKNSKIPEASQDYYFRGPVISDGTISSTINVMEGFLVNNVKRMPNGSFQFTIKGQSDIWYSNYPWAFVKYTPENMAVYKEYQELNKALNELNKKCRLKLDEVETLKR